MLNIIQLRNAFLYSQSKGYSYDEISIQSLYIKSKNNEYISHTAKDVVKFIDSGEVYDGEIKSTSQDYWQTRCKLAEQINETTPMSDYNPIEYREAIKEYNDFINSNTEPS